MTKAYILNGNDKIPKDRDMLDLYQGALENCCEVIFYEATDIFADRIKITKDDLFFGTINLYRKVFRDLGVKEPKVPDYPEQLKQWMNRKVYTTTIHEFRKTLDFKESVGNVEKYFIKPLKTKLFTGFVCSSSVELEKFRGDISRDTEIYVSQSVYFDNEFRVYVHNKKILDVIRYEGRWDSHPLNCDEVHDMVSSIVDHMPVSFSMDVGMDGGMVVLIECNDGYALGNYGLPPKEYFNMLRDRWLEIIK